MKVAFVTLKITKCGECPHLDVGMTYSMDGFDTGNDWTCKKANRSIEKFVEWRESDKPKGLPKWCPLQAPKLKSRKAPSHE